MCPRLVAVDVCTCSVPQQPNAGTEEKWGSLPADLLQQVTPLLDERSLQAARSVSRAWRRGLSRGVTALRPRMEANAVGLQWSQLNELQAAFPSVRELDLRQCPPQGVHGAHFADLTSLSRIYISSLQRSAVPRVLLAELRDLALELQAAQAKITIDLELRFGEYSLLWGQDSISDSDADIRAVSELPTNVQVTTLHMPQLCHAISSAGLASVMRLTSLRHLRLVTYGATITDSEFCALAGLTHLEHLWFGVVPYVTDAGLLHGLGSLTCLRELFLYDVGGITDAGIEALAARLGALEGLSLSKCHRLTNRGLQSLARLPMLRRLFLSENEHITSKGGVDRFPDGLKSLTVRQCPNVNRCDVHV